MKKSELLKLIEACGDDDDIDQFTKMNNDTSTSIPTSKAEIKANTSITMTAAEFMNFQKSIIEAVRGEQSHQVKQVGGDDAEIYI